MARDVRLDVRVDREVAPESRVDCTIDSELATEAAVDVLADWLSPVDTVVDRSVLTLVSADTVADTLVELDTSLESAAEIESASVLTAVDVTLAEFSVLIRVDVPVEATVSRLVSVEVPADTLWSEARLPEMAVCRPVVWLKASD